MTIVNGIRLVSNSEVQTAKDCPRKWWLAWHRGLHPRRRAVDGVRDTGTRIHVALAEHYDPTSEVDPLDALQSTQNVDRNTFLTQFDGVPIDETALHKLESQFDLEHAMVEGYLEWVEQTGVDSQLEVIAAETYVEVDFGDQDANVAAWGTPVKLIGKLDAQARSTITGSVRFIDLKTGDFPNGWLLRLNQQMLHYMVILWLQTGKPIDGALYTTLRRVKRTRAAKPPFYRRDVVEHNVHELVNYQAQLTGVISRIVQTERLLESGTSHHVAAPPRPSRDCTWKCEFFQVCPLFDDGSRVEAAIAEHYEVGSPLDYYGGREKTGDLA